MLSHDDYKEMVMAHALDALETAEARAMNDHLRDCEECRGDLDEWKETASSLAFATETADPSPALRARILQQAKSGVDVEDNRTIASIDSAEKPVAVQDSIVVRMPTPSNRAWNSRRVFEAIAASLIIGTLVVALVVLWQRNKAMENELSRLSRQANESQQEIARLKEEKGLYTAPDAQVASLKGTEMAKGAHAMLAYNRVTGHAMFVANGLPPAPAGMTYQLWFIKEGKPPMPGGVFAADAAGHAEMRGMVPPEGRDTSVYAVTLERAGGVTAPEGKMYLQSNAT